MDASTSVKYEKKKTITGEWIVIALIIVIIVIGIIVIWFVFVPQLFKVSKTVTPGLPPPKGCPVSNTPTGLISGQTNTVKPNVDLTWNAVLTTNTSGETIYGYNIYASGTPGITEQNKQKAAFSVVPQIRVYSTATGPIKANTIYYFVVTTVDSCGESPISIETSFTPT
jgi:hypothetical protein